MGNSKQILWLVTVISPFILTACDPRPKSQIDPAAFLGELMEKEGPQVDGIEATLLNSAHQAEEKREYSRAIQFYQQLLDSDKENIAYSIGLADNLRRMGQYAEAAARYGAALAKEPSNIDALEGRGLCLINKGDFDDAGDLFKQVIAKDPKRWRSLNATGILFVMKEMPKEALVYYDQALKVKPDEPAVLNNVGLTMAMTQDYPNAIDALKRAGNKLLDGDEQKKRADLNLALVYGLSGDMDKAEQVARRHLKESALNNNLGFYAYLADNKELAKAYLNNALSGSPVFYEKAWKNLETVGGSKVERSPSGNAPLNFAPQSRNQNTDTPFSVYPPAEKNAETAEAAPVMPVGQGQDLADLVLGTNNSAENAASLPQELPKVADKIPDMEMPKAAPVLPPKVEAPAPKVATALPAAPARPMLEGSMKPVSMTVVQGQGEFAVPIKQPMVSSEPAPPRYVPVAEEVAKPTVATAPSMAPKVAPESSKILQKIRQAKKVEPTKPTKPTIVTTLKPKVNKPVQDMLSTLPPEMGGEMSDIEPPYNLQPARLKDPHSDMIVFQAKQEAAAAATASAGGTPATTTAAVPAPAPAPVETPPAASIVTPAAATPTAPAVETTLKPRIIDTYAPQPIAPAVAASPAVNTDPAPAAAEQQPVQPVKRESTLDYIKQIF